MSVNDPVEPITSIVVGDRIIAATERGHGWIGPGVGKLRGMELRRFHYSFLVRDLEETRRFYVDVLGCREGRSAPTWIDFDMYGNQLSCHVGTPAPTANVGRVDGIVVPMPHFGALVSFPEYERLCERVADAGIAFIVSPRIRYAGEVGEQGTCFFLDPSGNAIEIKAFRRDDEVFAR